MNTRGDAHGTAAVPSSIGGMSNSSESTQTMLTVLCLAALIAGGIAWFVFSYGYIEDDAFIHLEFARSLAEGKGFAFNGHVVYGDTAPLWAMILAAIHSLGLGWLPSAKLACTAGLFGAVSGVWYLGRELVQDSPQLRFLPIAAVLVTVINPFFVHWSFSGMESVAALGLSFWGISLGLLGRASLGRCAPAAFLLSLGPLLRPEFMLLDALVGPMLLLRFWRAASQQPVARRMTTVAALGILMALPVALWSGYALETFGAIVPNTNLAKRGGPVTELGPRLLSVYAVGFPVTLAMLLPATLQGLARRRAPGAVLVLLLWPLACIAFYLVNHTVVQTRYALLSMPSMSIAILWSIAEAGRARLFAGTTAAIILAAIATIGLIVVPHITNKEKLVEALSELSAYLRTQIPPQAPVAVFAIGQIAFESRHPLVDVGGITEPSVIPHMSSPGETLVWAKAHGARYYVISEPPEPGAVRVFSAPVPFIGWTFQRSSYLSRETLSLYRLSSSTR
jgi:hypothetical protein